MHRIPTEKTKSSKTQSTHENFDYTLNTKLLKGVKEIFHNIDASMSSLLPTNYQHIVANLKDKIRLARQKASLAVNKELLMIYWEIGTTILQQQQKEKWGSKVIERLAADLRTEFPDFKGLSVRNLNYMRSFAEAFPGLSGESSVSEIQPADHHSITIMQQPAAQLPWGHIQVLLDKVKDPDQLAF